MLCKKFSDESLLSSLLPLANRLKVYGDEKTIFVLWVKATKCKKYNAVIPSFLQLDILDYGVRIFVLAKANTNLNLVS